jgi:hypothetical protein
MVSPKDALKLNYKKLRDTSVSIIDYQDSAVHDVVFEMVTADTYIAGVADRLLHGPKIREEHRRIISQDQLHGNAWILQDGTRFDLTPYPELLEYARIIENVRQACLRACRA